MKKFTVAVATLAFSALVSLSAGAASCPYKMGTSTYIDNVTKAVAKQKTCQSAAALAYACAMGSSGDLQPVGEAITKCEAIAKPHLTARDNANIKSANAKCDKENNQQGTMYMSMKAFCHLDTIKKYAK